MLYDLAGVDIAVRRLILPPKLVPTCDLTPGTIRLILMQFARRLKQRLWAGIVDATA